MILNGRGREFPVRGCEDGQPRAGEAVAADWAGRQPAGPARGDGPHHRRLSRLHQGQMIKTDQLETTMERKKNLDNNSFKSFTDRVCPAGLGGNLRQPEDPGGLDRPGGCG